MHKIVVLGLGKVGALVAEILQQAGFQVLAVDAAPPKKFPVPTQKADVSDAQILTALFTKADAVVSALPYHLNVGVAKVAHQAGIHYFDLTEDVPTTNTIRALAKTSRGVMAPQCGLAPGFIGIVGADLALHFDKIRSMELRVGALPQNPRGYLAYAFNWSAEGVVNEYLNDCEVIENSERKLVPALGGLEKIYVEGVDLEAFATSGGLGTLCETFAGRVQTLNYKTMRYPGHCELMRFFFDELHMRERRSDAGEILVNAKPPVSDDVVYVHAAVEGWKGKKLLRDEFVRAYYPQDILGQNRRAIAWTTACSVASVVELVRDKKLPQQGFLKQEDIPLQDFLRTQSGKFYIL